MLVILGDKQPSYSTIKNWVARFRTEHLSTEGKEWSGTWNEETIPENEDATHSIILDDRRISARKIAEILKISWVKAMLIIHSILDIRKLSA
jgi:hypothetical protein